MLLRIGHQVDESEIYRLQTAPGDASNIFTTTILQLIFKIVVKEKVLKLAQGFCPTYPNPATKALPKFFIRFWDSIHMFFEDMTLTFMRDTVCHRQVELLLNAGLQKFVSRIDYLHL